MTQEEICLRRLAGQALLAPVEAGAAAQQLLGFQAQFFANALHALRIRSRKLDPEQVRVQFVKNWTLRDTMHLFPAVDLPLYLPKAIYRSRDWSLPCFWNQRSDWALTPARQDFLSEVILSTLASGPQTRDALKSHCRAAGMTDAEEGSMFHPWGGGIRQLCERGFVYYLAQEEKVFCLTPPVAPPEENAAALARAERYFRFYGPASIHDAMYFFRATKAQVLRWLAALPVRETALGGTSYFYLETGTGCTAPEPSCLFLAGFDPLLLGYEKKESLILAPEHLRSVFNLAGIVAPTVLLDGRVAGTWKKRGRKLTVTLFDAPDGRARRAMQDCADTLWDDLSGLELLSSA